MNDEFSIFYVLRDIMPIAVILGVCCVLVVMNLFIKCGNNLKAKEVKTIWFGLIIGLYLTASPSIASKILFDFFPAESFCKFQDGRDQRLLNHCVLHVETKKAFEHRSGDK